MPALVGDRISITSFFNLIFRFEVKKIVDSGEVLANAADPDGTLVNFNRIFKDVDAITASVKEVVDFNVVINFVDIPDPTFFKVLVYDKNGVRASKTVYWVARGVS
jgi:hypothetical protein